MSKINILNIFICKECSKERKEIVVFWNNDDNVCKYCGSKDTKSLSEFLKFKK